MSFPVYIPLPIVGEVHPHLLSEVLAYSLGFQLYLLLKRRGGGPALSVEQSLWLLAGAILGAAVGAKMLNFAEWRTLEGLLGKTVVGGILGGWAGVEIIKKFQHIPGSTGGLVTLPLCVGIALGRVGCFLTGLDDRTFGVATTLPWGIDFGDGITRHPTQLYDIAVVTVIAIVLSALLPRNRRPTDGALDFRLFIIGYLGWRFVAEFIKPTERVYVGLSAIQWACALGVAIALWNILRPRRSRL
ncbi:MAG: prolipoprotein diacylglyceryl transferase family protein [Planctomycetota bacterium]